MAERNNYWFDSKTSSEVAVMLADSCELLSMEKVQALLPAPFKLIVQQGDVRSVVIMLAAEGQVQIPAWQGNSGPARSNAMGLNPEADFAAPVLQEFFEKVRDLKAAGTKEAAVQQEEQQQKDQAVRADSLEFYRQQVQPAAEAEAAAASGAVGAIPAPGAPVAATGSDIEHDPA